MCDPSCANPLVWQATYIRGFPSVLVIKLNRAHQSGRINQKELLIPRKLELSKYAFTNTTEKLTYALTGMILHYAINNQYGHCAAHIIDGDEVTTYDNSSVRTQRFDAFVKMH